MENRNKAKAESNGAAVFEGDGGFSLISNEKLLALYAGLQACRREGTNGNGRSGSMCGHEAALVGTTIDLVSGDVVCSREHGVLSGFSDGVAIPTLLLQPGNGHGASRNGEATYNGGRNGASTAAAGLAYTHAAIGTALANKIRTNGKVAVVFSSEESAEVLREAVHIAVVHELPMVFVHQADGDGEKAGRKGRSRNNGSELTTPWFPSILVDCHDVVALYRVAFEAISRARLGRGPTLIECLPFRIKSDKPADGNNVHAEDPIRQMEHYLRAKGLPIPG